MGQLGNQLDKQDDADNTVDVGNTVADRDNILIAGFNGGLCRREGGGGGHGAGEQTDHHGGEAVCILLARHPPEEDAEACDNSSGENDDGAQNHIGFKILFDVAEEFRPGDEAYRRDEEDQADVLQLLQRILGKVGRSGRVRNLQLSLKIFVEKAAEDQRDDEHAGGSQIDALYRNAAEAVADKNDDKHTK